MGAYDGGPYITYFHAALFVLFGGVRPLNHLASLIAGGTRELQGRVHHPAQHSIIANEETEELRDKVERMELILSMLTEKLREAELAKQERETRKEKGMLDVQDTFEKTAARLEDGARRREKKMEIGMEMVERRLDGLETTYDALSGMVRDIEKDKQGGDGTGTPGQTRVYGLRGLVLALLDWAESIWLALTFRKRTAYNNRRRSGLNNGGAYGHGVGYGASPARARKITSNGNGVTRTNGGSPASTSGLTSVSRRRSYDNPVLNLDTVLEEEAPGVDINLDVLGEPAAGDNDAAGLSALGGIRRRGGRMAPGALDAQSSSPI